MNNTAHSGSVVILPHSTDEEQLDALDSALKMLHRGGCDRCSGAVEEKR